MDWKRFLIVSLVMLIVLVAVSGKARAQVPPKEPELADQLDTLFERASTPANEQKFLSILVWVVFGGGATYGVMRGVKKIVHTS